MQVECKKAQPKESVLAANTAALLGKRLILSNLGVIPSLGMSSGTVFSQPALQQQQQHQQQILNVPLLQAALQQQMALVSPLGKKCSHRLSDGLSK